MDTAGFIEVQGPGELRCLGCNVVLDDTRLGVCPYWEPPFQGRLYCLEQCWPALVAKYDAEGWPPRPEDDPITRAERAAGRLSERETLDQRDARYRAWAAWRRRVLEEVNSGARQFSDNFGTKPGNIDEEVLRVLDAEFPVEPPTDAVILRPDFGAKSRHPSTGFPSQSSLQRGSGRRRSRKRSIR